MSQPLYFEDLQQFTTELLEEFEKNATQEEVSYLSECISKLLADIATGKVKS